MKKNLSLKLFILVFCLIVMIGAVSIVSSATTVGNTPVQVHGEVLNEDGSVTTEYGIIPKDKADAEAHPFVLFDLKTKELIKTFSLLTGQGEDCALYYACSTITSNAQQVALLMRRDYQQSNTNVNWVGGDISSSHVIFDLGGHKLTMTCRLLVFVGRDAAHCTFTMKNGTVMVGGQPLLRTGNEYGPNKVLNINFENLDFLTVSNYPMVCDDGNAKLNGVTNVNFKNCIFRVSSGMKNYLFDLGKNSEIAEVHVNVYGGVFNFLSPEVKLFSTGGVKNKTVTFHAYEGAYPQIVYSGESIPTEIQTPHGVAKYYEEGTSNRFRLYMPSKYGMIPDTYFDAEAHPFLLFDKDSGCILKSFNLISGEGEQYALWYATNAIKDTSKKLILWQRRDYQQPDNKVNWVMGNMAVPELTYDLDNHTLTLAARFLVFVSRNDAKTNFVMKDGAVNVGGAPFLRVGGSKYSNHKNMTFHFENIVFNNINTNSFVRDDILENPSTSTINFTDCTFHVTKNFTDNLFQLGLTNENNNVTVNVYGGTFHLGKATLNLYTTNGVTGKSVTFNANAEGEYPVVNVASSVDVSSYANVTKDGKALGLCRISTDGTSSTYTFSPFTITSAYLNLTNSLNFVYRVFLPAGYTNPVATFTIGDDPAITVNEYTVDENGLYCFKFTGIAPHKMGDCVTASVHATYGDNLTDTVINDKVSIKGYADALRAEYAEDSAMLALLDSLLVYGATSQVYMNYKPDELVAEIGELPSIPEALITITGEANASAYIAACGLMLDGAFDLRVGIKATSLEGLTLQITKGDVTTVVTLTEDMRKGEYIVVYYDGLYISDLDTEVTFTLKQNGESTGKSLTFSANAYLFRIESSENTALASLSKALYAYGMSAKAFVTPEKATVTVNYVYEDATPISSVTYTGATGSEYALKSPVVKGYYANTLTVRGTIYNDKTITVIYRKTGKGDDETMKNLMPGIVCWGDSLTAGAGSADVTVAQQHSIDLSALGSQESGANYVKVLENLIHQKVAENVNVANCGVGGESSAVIAARAVTETYYLYLGKTVTLAPSGSTVIDIQQYSTGGRLGILRQGNGSSVNMVTMTGKDAQGNEITITGQITMSLKDGVTDKYTCPYSDLIYTFTRTDTGTSEVTLATGTKIITYASATYDGNWCVIFIGQNGGYQDIEELIRQQQEIVNASRCRDKYIIIGLSSGDKESRQEMEGRMQEYWGEHYFSARAYLSSEKALRDAGFSDAVIEQYREDIDAGRVCAILRSDNTHLNAVGYALLGGAVFEKMVELGYFEPVLEYYNSLQ